MTIVSLRGSTTKQSHQNEPDGDWREGLSFAVLHKFFLMDWAGKKVRYFVAIFSALGVLVVTLYGLVLLIRTQR